MAARNLLKIFVVVFLTLFAGVINLSGAASAGGVITTLVVREKAGVTSNNYPLTFGHVFRKGDVPQSVAVQVGGTALPTQVDVKTRYPDGSLRHAVISVLLPKVTAGQDLTLMLVNSPDFAVGAGMGKTAILETNVAALINLNGLSGSGYSGNLTANLRAAINASSQLNYWLKGSICTEILVDQRLNNSLNATWEARFYPGTPYIRISHAMENVEANYRGNVSYAVSIFQGHSSPVQVYGPRSITHFKESRWRKVFWLGQAPPEVEIHYDTDYLISTRHILPYDTSLDISESTIQDQFDVWASRDTDIYGVYDSGNAIYAGFANTRFPATGGRPEIGPLPKWAVLYLLTWDNKMKEITMGQAELLANAPIHWREFDPGKTFVGRIINIDDRPRVRTAEVYATDGNYDPLPAAIGSTDTSPWSPDRSHQGSFSYIPYMVTGDYFYLQEMYYWAGWNLSQTHWDPGWGRDYSQGLIRDQIRGEAWGIRNIADAAAIAPDSHPEKAYFKDKVANNITKWEIDAVANTLRFMSVNEGAPSGVTVPEVTTVTSAWMEDFFSLSLSHMYDLGYDTSNILAEHSKFTIGRFSQPDFNWYNGAAYRFPTVTNSGPVTSWAQASSLYATQPTAFPNPDSPESYRAIAVATLSQLTTYPSGQAAYDWLKANVYTNEGLKKDPTWALVPRRPSAPRGLKIK